LKNEHLLEDIFGRGGLLSRRISSYESREGQLRMAELVLDTFVSHGCLAVEAGTGTGKSYAYTAAAVLWCGEEGQGERKVVIATSTINLQHQLMNKDLPFIRESLGIPFTFEILKGRSQYVCLRKLEEYEETAAALDFDEGAGRQEEDAQSIAFIRNWACESRSGMLSEITRPLSRSVRAAVSSDADTCLKNRCRFRDRCFVLQARRRASEADIIVVNHHLLFADIRMREHEQIDPEETAVLPPFTHLIIDEAHNLERNATSYYTEVFDTAAAAHLLHETFHMRFGRPAGTAHMLLTTASQAPRGSEHLQEQAGKLRDSFAEIDLQVQLLFSGKVKQPLRFEAAQLSVRPERIADVQQLFLRVSAELTDFSRICRAVGEAGEQSEELISLQLELAKAVRYFSSSADLLLRFGTLKPDNPPEDGGIYWLEVLYGSSRSGTRLHITPISLAGQLYRSLFAANDAVVCTSATLSAGRDFSFWEKQVGLSEAEAGTYRKEKIDSPFDYGSQMFLAVPADGPDPNDSAAYTPFLSSFCAKLINSTGGGALLLFTSYVLLKAVGDQLQQLLEGSGVTILRQGDLDRSALLSAFIKDENSILLATESFWEGVDAPGNTLRTVVITRIPFRVPTDPVFSARYEAVARSGGNPFLEISLPQAALKLKQGLGRLIRHRGDRGGVFIMDSRIVRKFYGPTLLESLPRARLEVGSSSRLIELYEDFLFTAG
jgi:ATP-dependent DNA helicase DinG